MRTGNWFIRTSAAVLLVAMIALAAAVDTNSAAQAAQATTQATAEATDTGTPAATFAASRFPLCPPDNAGRGSSPATPEMPAGTPEAGATMPGATSPAVANPTVYIGVYVSNVDHC